MSAGNALLILTRVGFEEDLIQEFNAWLQQKQLRAELSHPQAAVVFVHAPSGNGVITTIAQRLRDWRSDLSFAREILLVLADLDQLERGDRVAPIERAVRDLLANNAALHFASIEVYAPDAETSKPLEPLCRHLQKALSGSIPTRDDAFGQSLHILLLSNQRAVITLSKQTMSAPVPGGIARLKFPAAAPSRSTLKLDEAFLYLLSTGEQARWLRRGGTAVDLGACPGGWTYQLVRRGMQVQAVDNGKIADVLMRSGLVEHVRADGFKYFPKKAVDWMVCDMVENPLKVAALCAQWLSSKRCKYIMVNFKLPMKKRLAALEQAQQILLRELGDSLIWRAKQLFHDREEVTCLITRREYLR